MQRLDGKIALITGGNAGIGRETAVGLAKLGAVVTITSRSPQKGAEAVADIRRQSGSTDVDQLPLDLASFPSIEALSTTMHERHDHLDVLVNNAGIVLRRRQETPQGHEMQFGVNHLGHFLLTNRLLDLVGAAPAGRIVVVASDAHRFARKGLDFDDLQSENGYGPLGFGAYGRSKLANILFTRELAARLGDTATTVNAVHPGGVSTRLGRDGDGGLLGNLFPVLLKPFFKSPAEGAETSIWLAASADLEGQSGDYYADCERAEPTHHAQNDETARRLWEVSEQLVGLS